VGRDDDHQGRAAPASLAGAVVRRANVWVVIGPVFVRQWRRQGYGRSEIIQMINDLPQDA
jgi:hypothetical protein